MRTSCLKIMAERLDDVRKNRVLLYRFTLRENLYRLSFSLLCLEVNTVLSLLGVIIDNQLGFNADHTDNLRKKLKQHIAVLKKKNRC